MEYFTLNNGHLMPALGYGCNSLGRSMDDWVMEPDGDYRPLYYALNAGYRFFDTAIRYHNESALGLFLSEYSEEHHILRDEFFLSTKIPTESPYVESPAASRSYIERSLSRLHTDHLDMLLIHGPRKENMDITLDLWRVMEEMYDEGKLRNIGISNFYVPQLEWFLPKVRIKPAVNQIMINLGVRNQDSVDWCRQNDILPAAWSPLRNARQENIAELNVIGRKYGKTWAQVLLRYYKQQGILVVTKSHVEKEVVQNLNVFDFKLTDDELKRIDAMEGGDFVPKV